MPPQTQIDHRTRLTIGELAGRTGLRPSALRYYETQGLLTPLERTEAGYRLYGLEAEQTIHLIQRARRLGFSLADIRRLLAGPEHQTIDDLTVVQLAEERFQAIERQLTELLVLRHEMRLFLADLNDEEAHQQMVDRLLGRVCVGPPVRLSARSILDWLIERTHCVLGTPDGQALLEALQGQHVHVWQDEDAYHVLVTGHDPMVDSALRELAALEAQCHAHPAPKLHADKEGHVLTMRGENAFIFAQLFLALEQVSGAEKSM